MRPRARPHRRCSLAANQAVRIDPATYEPVASVAVGTDPAAVVGGGGSVWVASRQDGTVSVVDPDTNRVQVTIPASGSGPVGQGGPGLAFASGSLWVANYDQRQVVRVEPDADPTAIIPVRASPTAVVAAQDAVWVAGRTQSGGGLVARIDAGANQSSARQSRYATHRPDWPSPRTGRRSGWPRPPTRPSTGSTPPPAAWSSRSTSQRLPTRRHTGTAPSG